MSTKTRRKNHYRWNINSDVNYLLDIPDVNTFIYHSNLEDLKPLFPTAREVIHYTNAIVLNRLAETVKGIHKLSLYGLTKDSSVLLDSENMLVSSELEKGFIHVSNIIRDNDATRRAQNFFSPKDIKTVLRKLQKGTLTIPEEASHLEYYIRRYAGFLLSRVIVGSGRVIRTNERGIERVRKQRGKPSQGVQGRKETNFYSIKEPTPITSIFRTGNRTLRRQEQLHIMDPFSNILSPYNKANHHLRHCIFDTFQMSCSEHKFSTLLKIIGPTIVAATIKPLDRNLTIPHWDLTIPEVIREKLSLSGFHWDNIITGVPLEDMIKQAVSTTYYCQRERGNYPLGKSYYTNGKNNQLYHKKCYLKHLAKTSKDNLESILAASLGVEVAVI